MHRTRCEIGGVVSYLLWVQVSQIRFLDFAELFARTIFLRRFAIDDWREKPPLDLRLYGVTDPNCNKKQGRSNAAAVRAAISGGVTIVQLREKNADGANFCREAQAVIDIARPHGVCFLSPSGHFLFVMSSSGLLVTLPGLMWRPAIF